MEADRFPWKDFFMVGVECNCEVEPPGDEGKNDTVDEDEYWISLLCGTLSKVSGFLFFLNLAMNPLNPGPDDAGGVTCTLNLSKSVALAACISPVVEGMFEVSARDPDC
jgi:uncharacterized membrane protein HdeD (DUF308 family)